VQPSTCKKDRAAGRRKDEPQRQEAGASRTWRQHGQAPQGPRGPAGLAGRFFVLATPAASRGDTLTVGPSLQAVLLAVGAGR
jgi:hypothetical protein